MQFDTLPQLGDSVSKICLGTMTWGQQNSEQDAHEQMDYALAQGVNFWDTAEMYPSPPDKDKQGDTERFMGSWFAKTGKRNEVVLASKISRNDFLRDGNTKFVDFLPLLKQGDSCSQTVKPDRKNVLGGINISIMPCATRCTSPFSYSKRFSTFRTVVGNITATRTSLGRVSLIHDFKTATCVLAFVGQLSFHFKPTCIVNRFSQFAFFTIKLITLNITDHD